jgi:hypothetical protein
MSLASVDTERFSAQISLLRALNPQDAYPKFRLPISVEGACYDLVLPKDISDELSGCCTSAECEELDDPGLGTAEQLRTALVQRTSTDRNRDRPLYCQLELETVLHVRADGLCETAEYRYLFVSPGIALQLCRDAEADRLPPNLGAYVLLHRSVFTKCGGFELLAIGVQALSAATLVGAGGTPLLQSAVESDRIGRGHRFLCSLL